MSPVVVVVVVFWGFSFYTWYKGSRYSNLFTVTTSSSACVLVIHVELHNMQKTLVELLIVHQVVILEAFC